MTKYPFQVAEKVQLENEVKEVMNSMPPMARATVLRYIGYLVQLTLNTQAEYPSETKFGLDYDFESGFLETRTDFLKPHLKRPGRS